MTHLEWVWEVDLKIACMKIGIIDLNFGSIKINYKVKCQFVALITSKFSPTRNKQQVLFQTHAKSDIPSISTRCASYARQHWTLLV